MCVAEDESYVEPVDFDDLTLSTLYEEEPPRVLSSAPSTVPSENPPFGPSQTPPTTQSAADLQWMHINMSSEVSSSAMQSAFPDVRIQDFHTLYVPGCLNRNRIFCLIFFIIISLYFFIN